MIKNLATLSQEEIDKINVDLDAASIAFKERYGIPVSIELIKQKQPNYLLNWFHERLIMHRLTSAKLLRMSHNIKNKE